VPPHQDQPSDGTLIAAVLAGDKDQFAALVRRYETALHRVACSRMGRGDWAEDVVQETFLCTFKSLHSYDSRFSFRTWLWTILLNQCRRHLKRRGKGLLVRAWSDQTNGSEIRGQLEEQLQSYDTPPQRLAAKERAELLNALLVRLPEAQADALRLRFFGGLKFHEIADAMSCSLSTAKNRVRWGLSKMAAFLSEAEYTDELPVETCDEDVDHV